MIKLSLCFLLSSFFATSAIAEVNLNWRGYLSARANRYINYETHENSGQRFRTQFEQEAKFSSDLTLVNQVRFVYASLYTDISKNSYDSKDTREIYLGDNYLKYKSSSWVLQTGYQDVAWGEAFGFNYADIINPKDLRETFYSDYSESRIPLFMMNFKYFFSDGSLQLIYSPEPKFSKSLPVDLFTNGLLPQTSILTTEQDSPGFFKEHEYGGKLSSSFWGLDASLFYFSYLDRDPHYNLKSATTTFVELQESHNQVRTTGLSLAKTINDNFVLRTDLVYTQDKMINSVSGLTLLSTPVNMTNLLISLDTPTYNDFSAVLIFAQSNLDKNIAQSFREKNQSYSIFKISYDVGEEKTIDLSYTHEFTNTGHALQALYTWPVSPTLELRMGAENYWGQKAGQLNKLKNISNVFVGIKNYFQL